MYMYQPQEKCHIEPVNIFTCRQRDCVDTKEQEAGETERYTEGM